MPHLQTSPFVSARFAPRRRWRRVTAVLAAAAVVVGVVGSAVTLGGWLYAAEAVTVLALPSLEGRDHGERAAGPVVLVALVDGGRLATATLLVPTTPVGTAVDLPARLKVPLPDAGTGPLARALTDAGPDGFVRAVEDFSGLDLDHLVTVERGGLAQLVDVLGGIRACLPDGATGLAGEQAAALAAGDDPGVRAAVASAVADAALRTRSLVDPLTGWRAATVVRRAVRVDRRASPVEAVTALRRVGAADGGRLASVRLPVEGRREGGGEVLVAHVRGSVALLDTLAAGRAPSPTPAATEAPDPGEVAVVVLNGAGVDGLAARAARSLEQAGLTVVETGNVPGFGVARTEVRYPRGAEDAARTLSRLFRDAPRVAAPRPPVSPSASPDGVPHVVVALGQDFAEDPTIVDATTAAPAPPAPTVSVTLGCR